MNEASLVELGPEGSNRYCIFPIIPKLQACLWPKEKNQGYFADDSLLHH